MATQSPNSKMLLVTRSCLRASFIENVSSLRNINLERIGMAQDSTDLVLITNDTVEIRDYQSQGCGVLENCSDCPIWESHVMEIP
jgi:hypothetical protein